MNKLIVFYDADCPLCRRCRAWVRDQPAYLRVEFWPLQGLETRRMFPDLVAYQPDQSLVVYTDEGAVYRGSGAWLIVLWALRNWREWSYRLARPELRPHVQRFWNWVSANRTTLRPGRTDNPEALHRVLDPLPAPSCGVQSCHPNVPGHEETKP